MSVSRKVDVQVDQETLLKAGIKLLGLYFFVSGVIGFIQFFITAATVSQGVPINPPIPVGSLFIIPLVQMVCGGALIAKNQDLVRFLLQK